MMIGRGHGFGPGGEMHGWGEKGNCLMPREGRMGPGDDWQGDDQENENEQDDSGS
jgi:hypothetical protein